MLSHPICCQAQVSTWLSMRLSAVDLQLINALGTNLHTGTRATWRRYCRLRLADNAREPGDHVEQKTDSNQQSLRGMPGQWAVHCLFGYARKDWDSAGFNDGDAQSWSFKRAALDFYWLQNHSLVNKLCGPERPPCSSQPTAQRWWTTNNIPTT